MEKNDLREFASQYLVSKGYDVSPSAASVLSTSRLVNPVLLDELDDAVVEANTKVLMDDVIGEFDERKAKSPGVRKIRDIDVRPALKRRFCSLPPFCK